jgi:DNA-binding LytR/AlgR family response regulator
MKLKTVIVDDDKFMIDVMKDMCIASPSLELKHTFTDPTEFMRVAPSLDFELCLLDIEMPKLSGLQVAQSLGGRPVIFVTARYDMLKDVLDIPHVDVVTKPIRKEMFNAAIEKAMFPAYQRLAKNEFKLFTLAGGKTKICLKLTDIMLVKTDEKNTDHKQIFLKNGRSLKITECTLEEMLACSNHLLQANKSELISIEAVSEIVENSLVTLKGFPMNSKDGNVKLSRSYKKDFFLGIL